MNLAVLLIQTPPSALELSLALWALPNITNSLYSHLFENSPKPVSQLGSQALLLLSRMTLQEE